MTSKPKLHPQLAHATVINLIGFVMFVAMLGQVLVSLAISALAGRVTDSWFAFAVWSGIAGVMTWYCWRCLTILRRFGDLSQSAQAEPRLADLKIIHSPLKRAHILVQWHDEMDGSTGSAVFFHVAQKDTSLPKDGFQEVYILRDPKNGNPFALRTDEGLYFAEFTFPSGRAYTVDKWEKKSESETGVVRTCLNPFLKTGFIVLIFVGAAIIDFGVVAVILAGLIHESPPSFIFHLMLVGGLVVVPLAFFLGLPTPPPPGKTFREVALTSAKRIEYGLLISSAALAIIPFLWWHDLLWLSSSFKVYMETGRRNFAQAKPWCEYVADERNVINYLECSAKATKAKQYQVADQFFELADKASIKRGLWPVAVNVQRSKALVLRGDLDGALDYAQRALEVAEQCKKAGIVQQSIRYFGPLSSSDEPNELMALANKQLAVVHELRHETGGR